MKVEEFQRDAETALSWHDDVAAPPSRRGGSDRVKFMGRRGGARHALYLDCSCPTVHHLSQDRCRIHYWEVETARELDCRAASPAPALFQARFFLRPCSNMTGQAGESWRPAGPDWQAMGKYFALRCSTGPATNGWDHSHCLLPQQHSRKIVAESYTSCRCRNERCLAATRDRFCRRAR